MLQWISKHTGIKLPRFITKRISNNVNKTSSTKNESEKQQHSIDEICNDFWCLCKERFSRTSSGSGYSTISTTSTEVSTSFDEDDSSDGEEVVIISKQEEQKINNGHRRRRSKKTKKTPNIQLVGGEWCMPCQESDEGR